MAVLQTSTDLPAPLGRSTRAPSAPWWFLLIGLVLAAVFAAPLVYVIVRNIQDVSRLDEHFTSSATWDPLGRSLLLASSVAVTATAFGTALAWITTRSDIPLRRLWMLVAPLPLVFPSFVGATALISGFAKGGLLDRAVGPLGFELPELAGFWAALFVLTLFTYPYVYLPVAARLRFLPSSFEESARVLGRTPRQVFTSVVVPQLLAPITAGGLLVFLYTVSDFGAVQLLRYDTLTRVIYANSLADQPRVMALSLLLGIVAVLAVAAERALGRNHSESAMSNRATGLTVPLGRWRWPTFAAVAAFVGFALIGPLASLAHWTVRGAASSRARGALAIPTDGLGEAIGNTVLVSILAAVATVVLVLPIAYLVARHRSRTGMVADGLVTAGFALPGLVLGLSLVFWALSNDFLFRFYQTLPLLILGYVIHFGAQANRATQIAVASVPTRLDESARMLGAGRARRFITVDAPLMMPGLLAAGGLVLLSTMKELPATLFLRPTGFDTLSTRIWASMDNLSFAKAGLESMILLAVSAVLTWFLVLRRSDAL
ncbi:MAG: iron ABC transporter permease [Acidimicrobiales bacterium]|nr:iron ABC transporter permease [Acidimicrobiales bacterium]